MQIPDTLVLYLDRTHACKDLRPSGKPNNFALLPERHMQLTWVRCHWQSAWKGVQKMKHAHLSCALAVFSVLGSLDLVWWYTSTASRPGIVLFCVHACAFLLNRSKTCLTSSFQQEAAGEECSQWQKKTLHSSSCENIYLHGSPFVLVELLTSGLLMIAVGYLPFYLNHRSCHGTISASMFSQSVLPMVEVHQRATGPGLDPSQPPCGSNWLHDLTTEVPLICHWSK